MDFTTILVLLALMGTVCSTPVTSVDQCGPECENTKQFNQLDFQHLQDLQNTSVAPWSLTFNHDEDREPQDILVAQCSHCSVKGMVARPIYLKISVLKNKLYGNNYVQCKCPFELAVGCTCVNEQNQ